MDTQPRLTDGPFFGLPQDCWTTMEGHLPSKDLISVSTTCRSLRASTEHLVYRDISWSWDTTKLPLRQLLQLLRTTMERPNLAYSVAHVSLLFSADPWSLPEEYDMDWGRESSARIFASVVERSIEIVQKAQLARVDEWIAALWSGNFYAFVGILISQVPNIKSLCLDYSFVCMGGYPGRMMEHAILSPNGTLPAFNRLERVDYGGNVPMPGEYMPDLNDPIPNTPPSSFNHDQFAGWFYLPALQHLEMWLRNTTKLHERPPDLTNLRTLILARSTIPEEDVPFLLGRASSLQNLHLGLVYSYYDESVFQSGDCIAQALETVSSTVERLSISLGHVPVVVGHGHPD